MKTHHRLFVLLVALLLSPKSHAITLLNGAGFVNGSHVECQHPGGSVMGILDLKSDTVTTADGLILSGTLKCQPIDYRSEGGENHIHPVPEGV